MIAISFTQKKYYLCGRNPNKDFMSKIFSFIDCVVNHKCLVVIVITALFVCFLDANSIWERHYRWENISLMKAEINDLKKSYEVNTKQLELLKTSSNRVEQIAREKYYMTRDDEDLFIIQHGDQTQTGNVVDNKIDNSEPEV